MAEEDDESTITMSRSQLAEYDKEIVKLATKGAFQTALTCSALVLDAFAKMIAEAPISCSSAVKTQGAEEMRTVVVTEAKKMAEGLRRQAESERQEA